MTGNYDPVDAPGAHLPQPAIEAALQRSRVRLPVPSLRALAGRALPIAVSVATAAMATIAAERALSRAVTRILPPETPDVRSAGPRRIVVTERVHVERFRIRR